MIRCLLRCGILFLVGAALYGESSSVQLKTPVSTGNSGRPLGAEIGQCATCLLYPTPLRLADPKEPSPLSIQALDASGGGTPSVIELLCLYTPAAEAAAGGVFAIKSLIRLGVEETNRCFLNSQSAIEIDCVHIAPIDYEEDGHFPTDLSRLHTDDDGHMDGVHDLRNQVGADLVCLVFEPSTVLFAGISNILRNLDRPDPNASFFLLHRAFLTANFTMAHEIGHCLGLSHKRGAVQGLFTDSYGYQFFAEQGAFRTVMANRPGRQIPYFSNPLMQFMGAPLGQASKADSVRTLKRSAPVVSGYRPSWARYSFVTDLLGHPETETVLNISVRRSGDLSAQLALRWSTASGTALSEEDFLPASGELVFEPSEQELSVSIEILDDDLAEGVEDFAVILTSEDSTAVSGEAGFIRILIRDDDSAHVPWVDPFFPSGGTVNGPVNTTSPLADGRLLVGGAFTEFGNNQAFNLALIDSEGLSQSLFTEFQGAKYRVNEGLEQQNGQFLIVGEFNEVNFLSRPHIARLNPDGSVDEFFSPSDESNQFMSSVQIQEDGKILAGGAFTKFGDRAMGGIVRLNRDGSLDQSFEVGQGGNGGVHDILILDDQRIMLIGSFTRFDGISVPGMVVLSGTGGIDPTFKLPWLSPEDSIITASLSESGEIWVGGRFQALNGGSGANIAKLGLDGNLIPEAQFIQGANGPVEVLLAGDDGFIYVAGRFTGFEGMTLTGLARFNSEGVLDAGFKPHLDQPGSIRTMSMDSTQRLIIGGSFRMIDGYEKAFLARLGKPQPEPWATLRTTGVNPRNEILLEINVVPGFSYLLEESENLRQWSTAEQWSGMDGSDSIVIAVEISDGLRFFRVKSID